MVISGNNLVINGTTVEAADLINIASITSDVQTQLNSKANTSTVNSQVWTYSQMPVGSVLQVQSTTFSGIWSAAGGSDTFYNVTPLNVTITPKSATSKILIKTTVNIGSGYWEIQGRFIRNGTAIGLGDQRGSRTRCSFVDNRYEGANGVRNSWGAVSSEFLDSPATTSQITYGVALNGYSSYTIGVNYNPYDDSNGVDYFGTPISTLTVIEIGA